MIGEKVLVRTYSAGVHVGILLARDGREVRLHNARRIWRWAGAFTLSEIAMTGLNSKESRMSVAVPEILLTEAIELIPITAQAWATLEACHE